MTRAFHFYKAIINNKIKYKKYHTAGTGPKCNRKIVERGKMDTDETKIHDLSPT